MSTFSKAYAARQAAAQLKTHVRSCGIPYRRVPYGTDYPTGLPLCRDCGVEHGQLHVPTCCVERCPVCTKQALACDCADDDEVMA